MTKLIVDEIFSFTDQDVNIYMFQELVCIRYNIATSESSPHTTAGLSLPVLYNQWNLEFCLVNSPFLTSMVNKLDAVFSSYQDFDAINFYMLLL